VVVFRLDGREHALPLEHVVEVFRMVAVAAVPEAHRWVLGVVNLRGRVIPVIDLRRRLGLSAREPELATPIIVVKAGGRAAGLVADDVVEVMALPGKALDPPDDLVGPATVVSSIAHAGNRLVLVLDTMSLLEGSEDLRATVRGGS
jgi:purine-binding chemotaxis protein CheW